MKIGINASFLRKQHTGIGQVTANFLKKLADMQAEDSQLQSRKAEFVLYLEENTSLRFPKNFKKSIFLPKYKRDDLLRKIWWEKFMLPKRVKKDGCDVFLSLYQCPTVLRSSKKIKHVMLAHDLIPKLFPEYLNNGRKKTYWNLTEKGIKEANKIIAVSRRTEKDIVHHLGIDPKKITVSYIDSDEIYEKEVSEEQSRRILEKYGLKKGYIYNGGGLEKRKNAEGLLRAYKRLIDNDTILNKDIPDLVISGKLMPELAPLIVDAEQLVKGLELEKKVKLLDFVPQEDLPALYKNASIFIYPSFYEGFGIPVLEAMKQGTPVITSKKSSLPEVGGDSVLYCEPSDIDDISMVIKNVLVNSHLKDELSIRGLKRSKNFSWDKFVEKFLNILKNDF